MTDIVNQSVATANSAAVQPARNAGQTIDIGWREPQGFVWLSIRNFLLTLITLGIYSFWGKTEVRRRIWNAIRVNGEPLEYTGTGWELFKGFLLAMLFVGGGAFAYGILMAAFVGPDSPLFDLAMLPLYIVFFWLFGLASYRTWRYRLRRTRWRGIRGTLTGSPVAYANLAFLTSLVVPLSLGWAAPWRNKRLYERVTNETRIGTANLQFEPTPSLAPLYKAFALPWLLAVSIPLILAALVPAAVISTNADQTGFLVILLVGAVILALVLAYLRYRAITMNWLALRTRLHNGRFQLNLTTGDFLKLLLGNILIAALSLGILMPVVQKRLARHIVERLSFEGTVDLAAIGQADDALEKSGEGLGEFFDVDAF